jgi:putative endopeptidase
MKLLYFLSLLICVGLVSCGDKKQKKSKGDSSSMPEGISFIETSYMDSTVAPGDNFYDYAGGAWRKNNPVPASETRWGAFDMLSEFNKNVLKQLTQSAAAKPGTASSPSQMVGDLFTSGMDTSKIEELGLEPIQIDFDRINNISDVSGLPKYLAKVTKEGGNPLFSFYVSPDEKNVNQYVVGFWQNGLGLPDKGYYLKNEKREKEIRLAYENHIAKMFELKGETSKVAAEYAEVVVSLETKLAKASMDRTAMRDPYKTYNKYKIGQFDNQLSNLSLEDYLTTVGAQKIDSVLIGQPSFLRKVDDLLASESIEDWKTYLTWHVLKNSAYFVSSKFANEKFNFYGKTLSGQKEQKPRWKRVLGVVNGSVGHQLGKLYVEKYFTPEAKTRMKELVDNLQVTFGERIDKLDWMSPETKKKAQAKLNTFVKKIGYPDQWRSYAGLEIAKDDYIGNIRASNIFDFNYMLKKLGKAVDKSEWQMTPQTVNAYYNPSFNEIVFPAGILQYPFFTLGADDAVIYGAIGAVIGHEMTHGFDDQGSQYAADGNLKNWWTDEDKKKFEAKTERVVEQFNNYKILDDKPVNGELTLGENIADLGGVTIAYEAFKKTEQGKSADKIDGFTPDQRFFLSWAQVWRLNIVDEEAAKRLVTDPHSPGIFRCNGPLSNFEPFYKAFDVKETNKMYRPMEERAVIW